MNIKIIARRAGFDVRGEDILPPYIDPSEPINKQLEEFAKLVWFLAELDMELRKVNGEEE